MLFSVSADGICMRKLFGVAAALVAVVSIARAQEPAPALITILAAPDMTAASDVTTSPVRAAAKKRRGAPDNSRSIVLDGVLDARLRADQFFTVTVLSGEHDLRSENAASFSFELAPGEHAYIWLTSTRTGELERSKESFVKLSCSDVKAYLGEAHPKPATENDVYAGMVVFEKAFPGYCESVLGR
jgi:hypothetical protein